MMNDSKTPEQSAPQEKPFDQWALLEIMGHRRFAGRVSEQTVGGTSLVRLDVPATNHQAAFTKLWGAAAIYCITPVSEATARKMAEQLCERPVEIYEPPALTDARNRQPVWPDEDDDDDFPQH
jgi:hypothetical protein